MRIVFSFFFFSIPACLGLLRKKDVEQALLLEEKISLQLRLLAAAGLEPPSPPSYRHLVMENVDTNQVWREVLTAVQVNSALNAVYMRMPPR